jgi:hypothetical protein
MKKGKGIKIFQDNYFKEDESFPYLLYENKRVDATKGLNL